MPVWLLVHGILIVIWGSFWISVYYLRLWVISFPFNKMTSLKIAMFLFLPLTWLCSSLSIGLVLFSFNVISYVDKIALIIIPLILILLILIFFWFSNSSHQQREAYLQKSVKNFKDNCQNWIKQFPFINEDKYDLQVFLSKDRPVGRMIIYELNYKEEVELKEHKEELPNGVTLLFLKK